MSINEKLASDVQKATPGKLVTLFELDMTGLGGETVYFTENITATGTAVVFNGVTYPPIDCEATGFESVIDGALPRPKFKIANTGKALMAEIAAYDDLVGAVLTRRRTFTKYLDGEVEADINAQFPADTWLVEKKESQNKFFIEWELSSYLDFQGVKIPKRQILRDTCLHVYRIWTGSEFDYSEATCPYTGDDYFDRSGTTVSGSPESDVCGKKLSDCTLRFTTVSGVGPLPTRAFPAVAKARA